METTKTVCFSGHRTKRLPKGGELVRLEAALYAQVDKAVTDGYETFLFGVCHSFDMLAAKQALLRKRRDPGHIKLVAVVPFKAQAKYGNEALQIGCRNGLGWCDGAMILYEHHRLRYELEQDRFIVDQSGRLICFYNGGRGGTGHTVSYAKSKGLEVVTLFEDI